MEFLDSRPENYGQLLANNSWTGLMGMLQRGVSSAVLW